MSPEQEALRDAFADFYLRECPPATVRAAEPAGHDAQLWERLAGIGGASMGLPEEAGGDGASLVDLALVTEEHGRAAAPVPLIEQAVAGRLLAACADTVPAGLLADAAAGTRLVTLALQPAAAGRPQLVPAGAIAPDVVALADGDLVLTRAGSLPAHVPNQASMPLAWWDVSDSTDRVTLATGPLAQKLFRRAVAEWKVLTAAALTGLTEAAMRLAVEFAKTRETMGVPIGSLQGVAFPLADAAIGVSGARNLAWRAAWMLEHEPGVQDELAAAALAYAAGVATTGTQQSAHMHGGLGFTIEADVSLYFLRAKGWSVIGGDPAADLIAVGDALTSHARA